MAEHYYLRLKVYSYLHQVTILRRIKKSNQGGKYMGTKGRKNVKKPKKEKLKKQEAKKK